MSSLPSLLQVATQRPGSPSAAAHEQQQPPSWISDVEVQSKPLATTGGHTWAAARRLAAYLSAEAAALGLARPGCTVLELGAGTGWLGVTIARNLPSAALVCLTEQPDGLEWLRRNVELNAARLEGGLPHVRVQACDWRDYECSASAPLQQQRQDPGELGEARQQAERPPAQQGQQQEVEEHRGSGGGGGAGSSSAADDGDGGDELDLRSLAWDFIVGSDLIYGEDGARSLPRVLAALMSLAAAPAGGGGGGGGATVALYCHTRHRYDLLDQQLFEELRWAGLECEEVWEASAPPPPASPPVTFPPASLFPDQRIAVYRITVKK